MNSIEDIKKEIVKKAVVLKTGGFKPTNSISESWIGKVYLYKENEEIPTDTNGELMIPLFQLSFENLPLIPDIFCDTKALTVFISSDMPIDFCSNGENWCIREYNKTDNLVIKKLTNPNSFLKAFPLQAEIINEDYPVWDGGGLSYEKECEIIELEKVGIIESYYDIANNNYGHKIEGYPSFCQPGIDFGEDFQFTLQIASDQKANLNIVDGGTIFLAKNNQTGEWKYYCDFY